jgi:anthranilate synthase component 1
MIGAHPVMEIVAKEDKVTTMDHEKGTVTEQIMDDPMEVPRKIMEGWHPQEIDDLPETFSGEHPWEKTEKYIMLRILKGE